MKSCICFKEGNGGEGSFSTIEIQSLLWTLYYFIYCACRDLNFRPQLCAVIKFMGNLKVALLAYFSFMSRLIIVCRDINKLRENNKSSGCNIWHSYTLLVNK